MYLLIYLLTYKLSKFLENKGNDLFLKVVPENKLSLLPATLLSATQVDA